MNKSLELLKRYWGFDAFRKPQESIIECILKNEDVFVLLPTGAGKSLCYQLPALMKEGICLVISPLIALMEDQVKSLERKGIKAIALNAKYNRHDTIIAFDNLMYGGYKFLYLSPEKLQSEFIQEKISQLSINLIAIDEAHCISQWGHDFRPAYLKIPVLKEICPEVPTIALTATATKRVITDIVQNLQLASPQIFNTSFFRNNLSIRFWKKENIREGLIDLVNTTKEPVIVYTGTRKNTIHFNKLLSDNGIASTYYHGGLGTTEKTVALDQWKIEKKRVMVATNAFGMGIDKANVRMIIHMHIPNSIENYVQEIGRAGRDQQPSVAYLLYNDHVLHESQRMLESGIVSPDLYKEVYTKLNDFYQIAHGELTEEIYSFDLQDFCMRYEFGINSAYHVLNNLHNQGILFFDQNPNRASLVKIIESNKTLLQYKSSASFEARVLQMLLRTHGGIHEQFTNINETFLAKKLSAEKKDIIKALSRLDQDKVIMYKKSAGSLHLKFLVPREDAYIFHHIKRDILERNKIKKEKSKAMLGLIGNDLICRQVQLSAYFGETMEQSCGRCDVCLDLQKVGNEINYKQLATAILNLLGTHEALSTHELETKLSADKIKLIKTLELLLESKKIDLNLQQKFYLIT